MQIPARHTAAAGARADPHRRGSVRPRPHLLQLFPYTTLFRSKRADNRLFVRDRHAVAVVAELGLRRRRTSASEAGVVVPKTSRVLTEVVGARIDSPHA